MQADPLATPEFLLAKGARFANDQINLPASGQVNHIEHRLPLVSFQSRVQISVVLAAGQRFYELSQLRRGSFDYEINVLCGSRRAIVGTGKLPGEHIANASLVKRRRDSLEDFRDAHLSPAGKGAGRNASRNNSRPICASVHSG
jgi:hypothetical protein